ncbi:cytoplasm chaperone protein [Rhodovulum sp. PH10]|uniref:protein-export chaperone SecB n=1 Tax=Rhodovulum sp. PH10 TaxID=1187851 RepID=UPI00027C2498|nr:protein-export chaperone SecB [Rhodovulum sp. PH10]EJW13078.1 cytoplasm chaperone protein [Rhodovulum sp. PH10]
MATTTNGGDEAHPAQPTGPSLNVLAQYVKDFSFENPNAPRSLMQAPKQPQIGVQINVNSQAMSATEFEVELKLEGKAELDGNTLFGFDLLYAGVFRLQNIPQENLPPLLMIECPRLLFPFAREIIGNAVVHGGYPPLLLDPIDFVSLYQQKVASMQAQQPTTA